MKSTKWILIGSLLFAFLGVMSDIVYGVSQESMYETGHDDVYDQMSIIYRPILEPIFGVWYDLWPDGVLNGQGGVSRAFVLQIVPWFTFAMIVGFSARFILQKVRAHFSNYTGQLQPESASGTSPASSEHRCKSNENAGDKWIYLVALLFGFLESMDNMLLDIEFHNEIRSGKWGTTKQWIEYDYTTFVFWINRLLDIIPVAAFAILIGFSVRFVWRKVVARMRG